MQWICKSAILTVMITCLFSSAKSQTLDSTQKEWSAFRLGINYTSNLNYYGRTDSLRSSGFFPLAEVWFTPGLYVNAAPIFINNKVQHFEYAGTVITAGYQFNSNDKWLGNLYVLKPLYKETTALVQAALKAQTGVVLTYANPVLNLSLGGDMMFSDQKDYGVSAGIDHLVRIPVREGRVLAIDPSAYVYAGTQQFSRTHIKKNNFPFLPGNEEYITETSAQFNVLAYEFSVPVLFVTEKLEFAVTPSYIIPQNLMEVEGPQRPSEQGRKTFYVTLGSKINF